MINALLQRASLIFWDFDGVIKDSVMVKSVAFEKLFLPYGREIADRVKRHHETHGGVSRFEKIPLYLSWAGESGDAEQIQNFCDRFSKFACQSVIDAPWVPGVRKYLQTHHGRQRFILVSATQQAEMEQIVTALEIAPLFCEVHGAPKAKTEIICDVLQRFQCRKEDALMVGDAETDLLAAEKNHVPFLLRRTELNQRLTDRCVGAWFEKLGDEE